MNISTSEFAEVQLAVARFINNLGKIYILNDRSIKPVVYVQQGNTSGFSRSRIYTKFGRIYRSGFCTISHTHPEYALLSDGLKDSITKYATIGWDFENNYLIVSEEDENNFTQTYERMNRLVFYEDNKVLQEQLDLENEIADIRKNI